MLSAKSLNKGSVSAGGEGARSVTGALGAVFLHRTPAGCVWVADAREHFQNPR